MEESYPAHSGRYTQEKHALAYADLIRKEGFRVEVRPVTVFDVVILGRPQGSR